MSPALLYPQPTVSRSAAIGSSSNERVERIDIPQILVNHERRNGAELIDFADAIQTWPDKTGGGTVAGIIGISPGFRILPRYD
jgi:hypothetical protein